MNAGDWAVDMALEDEDIDDQVLKGVPDLQDVLSEAQDATAVAAAVECVQGLEARVLNAAREVLGHLPPDVFAVAVARCTTKPSDYAGGRQHEPDPTQDPTIDPKTARKILNNRRTAAISKIRRKLRGLAHQWDRMMAGQLYANSTNAAGLLSAAGVQLPEAAWPQSAPAALAASYALPFEAPPAPAAAVAAEVPHSFNGLGGMTPPQQATSAGLAGAATAAMPPAASHAALLPVFNNAGSFSAHGPPQPLAVAALAAAAQAAAAGVNLLAAWQAGCASSALAVQQQQALAAFGFGAAGGGPSFGGGGVVNSSMLLPSQHQTMLLGGGGGLWPPHTGGLALPQQPVSVLAPPQLVATTPAQQGMSVSSSSGLRLLLQQIGLMTCAALPAAADAATTTAAAVSTSAAASASPTTVWFDDSSPASSSAVQASAGPPHAPGGESCAGGCDCIDENPSDSDLGMLLLESCAGWSMGAGGAGRSQLATPDCNTAPSSGDDGDLQQLSSAAALMAVDSYRCDDSLPLSQSAGFQEIAAALLGKDDGGREGDRRQDDRLSIDDVSAELLRIFGAEL